MLQQTHFDPDETCDVTDVTPHSHRAQTTEQFPKAGLGMNNCSQSPVVHDQHFHTDFGTVHSS